mgnify:FL=1
MQGPSWVLGLLERRSEPGNISASRCNQRVSGIYVERCRTQSGRGYFGASRDGPSNTGVQPGYCE